MKHTKLPTFEANIMAPVDKAIEDDRSIEDIAGIIDEIKMFACPICGHITPDHSWIGDPMACLKPGCPCEGMNVADFDDADNDELVADIDVILRGKAA